MTKETEFQSELLKIELDRIRIEHKQHVDWSYIFILFGTISLMLLVSQELSMPRFIVYGWSCAYGYLMFFGKYFAAKKLEKKRAEVWDKLSRLGKSDT